MNQINIVNLKTEKIRELNLDKKFNLSKKYNHAIFSQVIAENAAKRQGTHSTLTKAEVRGGGKKPRPQKHSGRARQGSIRNPQWVGGGIVFGPKPTRNYKLSINAKSANLAFKAALYDRLSNNQVIILDDKLTPELKTKDFGSFIKKMKFAKRTLFVLDTKEAKISKKINNIIKTLAKTVKQTSVADILLANNIVFTINAWNQLLMEVLK